MLWYKYLYKVLSSVGFIVCPYDEGVFIYPDKQIVFICHVDDIIVMGPNKDYIDNIVKQLNKDIQLDFQGELTSFLGNDIYIDREKQTIEINQYRYIDKILNKFNILEKVEKKEIIPQLTPYTPNRKLEKNKDQADLYTIERYQQQIGSILYTSLKTRPDLCYTINELARYMFNPSLEHIKKLNKVQGYIYKFPYILKIYDCLGNNLQIEGYLDSNWGNSISTGRSTSGYIFSLSNSPINPLSWNSQLQKTPALSTGEAEYIALREGIKEAKYLYNLFEYFNNYIKIGYTLKQPTIYIDSTAVEALAKNTIYHKRTKHINITYYYIRQVVKDNKIILKHIDSKRNLADWLTKPINRLLYRESKDKCSLKER